MAESGKNGKKTVLIVDDDAEIRFFVQTVAKTAGFGAATASNGREALKSAEKKSPDLVFLDVMMPGIEDGLKTYAEFRRGFPGLPVVMLSAIAKKTFFHSLKMLTPPNSTPLPEPDAYLEKPPEAVQLEDIIRRFL
jgi:CheY-like chemotaxis protein